ncbi:MAG: NAD(P)/FAD-dependent oxidoreductase [Methyloprofundus sp.]|nr:NAD(P)/FAD-dependent oxidoreductase [Methyloprofundus sp.]
MTKKIIDVIIIGAGASGLMCAIEAAKRGRSVLIVDHANKAGKKILMSGGGRCNFTNYTVEAENYLSENAHFCKSALSRFTQWDFLAMVQAREIPYHEREHGQLFCNETARDILNMLLDECHKAKVKIQLQTTIKSIKKEAEQFALQTETETLSCSSLVVATGGLSIPKMGASPFGYKIAEQFGIAVTPTKAGLVPFTWPEQEKQKFSQLSGIALPVSLHYQQHSFTENLLFTHRGISGPAVLQLSSYWQEGERIEIDLLPSVDLNQALRQAQTDKIKLKLSNYLGQILPKKLLPLLVSEDILGLFVLDLSYKQIALVTENIQQWQFTPNGTEGYRTAEATVGGVDCHAVSSKTLESNKVQGLYFVGEVLDVTGWLGGYNFQWAWASGWCAGQCV